METIDYLKKRDLGKEKIGGSPAPIYLEAGKNCRLVRSKSGGGGDESRVVKTGARVYSGRSKGG